MKRKGETMYDEHRGTVVCALNEEDAKSIHPNGGEFSKELGVFNSWVDKTSDINITFIGKADSNQIRGVILSDFKAG